MRSFAASQARRLRAALACLLFAALPPAPVHAMELAELLRGMASAPGVHARFVETKEIALLSAPLESEGEIFFVPPRRFARITRRPSVTRFVVDGDRLLFSDAAGEQKLDAGASRVARAVVENFIVLWSGDAAALEERYEAEFGSRGDTWTLSLRPREPMVAAVVARVVLEGEGPKLRVMHLEEPNGDRTVTRYHDVEVAPIPAAELARAFPGEAAP